MSAVEALKRFTEYCEWQTEGKSPHIEASRKYGLSLWQYFEEIMEIQNIVYNKASELTALIEADGFDIEGLRRQKGEENAG